jgi:hypothetical protein
MFSLQCLLFFLYVHKMHKWAFVRIDRYIRSFLWKGNVPDRDRGGHSLINWQTYLLLRKWGGGGGWELKTWKGLAEP